MSSSKYQQIIEDIEKSFPSLPVKYDVPWKEITTLGVGGDVPIMLEPPDDISLIHLLKHCKERNIDVFVLGGGSNTVGMDEPFNGIVLRLFQNDFMKLKFGREHVTAGAGVRLHDFIFSSAHKGFGGLSGLAGIPGTVGGALRMNAGANGVCIGDAVMELCGFDMNGEPWTEAGSSIKWGYRSSSIPENVIITAAIFKLEKVGKEQEIEKIKNQMAVRKKSNPPGRSAGCVFKNPSPSESAGRLIDLAGMKKASFADIEVSDIHANYFINKRDASENDFVTLAKKVRSAVFEKTGINLEPEVRFINKNREKEIMSSEKNIKVTVLKGGTSSERDISLISGKAVADSLRKAGYAVTEYDIKKLEINDLMRDADVVFPVLHGGFGESGEIQKLMEDAGLRFVGCSSSACDVIMDKIKSKKLMDKNSICTAPYAVLDAKNRKFPSNLSLPVVVKAPCEGSTFGVSIVTKMEDWDRVIDETLKFGPEILVEKFIKGTEITVGLVDGKALPVIEIRYPGEFFDFDAKYTHAKGDTLYLCPPQTVSADIQKKAQDIAEKFYKAVDARDMLRVDMIISPEGPIYVLEGNSIPGFTESSLLPKSANVAGMDFPKLCSFLVSLAMKR